MSAAKTRKPGTYLLDESAYRSVYSGLRDWCTVALELGENIANFRLSFGQPGEEESGDRQIRRLFMYAHFLAVSLQHIHQHVAYLLPSWDDQLKTIGQQFSEQFNSGPFTRVRNLLEHSADYLAGNGLNPELVVNPASAKSVGFGDPNFGKSRTSIGAFGNICNLDPIMDSVQELGEGLQEFDPSHSDVQP